MHLLDVFLMLQWRIAEVCQRLEHDLYILGVTAIEDRLQVKIYQCPGLVRFTV